MHVRESDGDRGRSAPLAEFRSERAYVLLGDPGAGKSGSVQEGVRRGSGKQARYRTSLHISDASAAIPSGTPKTLFIDGLDEVRAGRPDARRPMDLILERLEHLGSPNLRLSCRAADWLGRNDLQEIIATAGYGDVRVLHLAPLRTEDILRILADLGAPDPHGFLDEARDRGLEGLLGNPHSLGLLVKAAGPDDGGRPGRKGTPSRGLAIATRPSTRRAASWLASPIRSTAAPSAPHRSSRLTGSWPRPGTFRRSSCCPTRRMFSSTCPTTPKASALKTFPTATSRHCCGP